MILELLKDGSKSVPEIAKAVSYDARLVGIQLAYMASCGKIRRASPGVYGLPIAKGTAPKAPTPTDKPNRQPNLAAVPKASTPGKAHVLKNYGRYIRCTECFAEGQTEAEFDRIECNG